MTHYQNGFGPLYAKSHGVHRKLMFWRYVEFCEWVRACLYTIFQTQKNGYIFVAFIQYINIYIQYIYVYTTHIYPIDIRLYHKIYVYIYIQYIYVYIITYTHIHPTYIIHPQKTQFLHGINLATCEDNVYINTNQEGRAKVAYVAFAAEDDRTQAVEAAATRTMGASNGKVLVGFVGVFAVNVFY